MLVANWLAGSWCHMLTQTEREDKVDGEQMEKSTYMRKESVK